MHLEGQQSVLAALRARRRNIELVLISENSHAERFEETVRECGYRNVPVRFAPRTELDRIAYGKSHGGVVALCGRKQLDSLDNLEAILRTRPGWPFLLLLEGVEDVQHLGYALRSAEALGAHAVLLKKHLWDFDETTLSRTSSGAFERVPLIKLSEPAELRKLRKFDIELLGCIAGARRLMYEENLNRPIALAVGGEKRGLSGQVRDECTGFVKIPMAPGSASSLSLTHAACLLLGEVARQRLSSRKSEADI